MRNTRWAIYLGRLGASSMSPDVVEAEACITTNVSKAASIAQADSQPARITQEIDETVER